MADARTTTRWARTLVDELVRCGVTDACIAPGSRSTPLVLAAAAHPELRIRVFLDERCAGFFALGLGKGSGRPAAVITTSGTAVANLLPAAVEAHQSDTPLLLLTADRPHRLRGSDANQTIDQVGLFGSFVRAFRDVAPASDDPRDLRHLRTVAARAVAEAVGGPGGPVHLNIPFDKPLEPEEPPEPLEPDRAGPGAPDGAVATLRISRRRILPSEEDLAALVARLERALRPVLVAGPLSDPEAAGAAAVRLAARWRLPLLADPLSGARWRDHHEALVLGAYDLFLAEPDVRRALRPDLVLRVGQAPTSRHLGMWLEEHRDVEQVVVDAGSRWKDHGGSAALYVRAEPAATLEALATGAREALATGGRDALSTGAPGDDAAADSASTPDPAPTPDPAWRDLWRRVEAATHRAVREAGDFGPGHEGAILREVVERTPAGAGLFVSSSMPVRDLDAFGTPGPRPRPVIARGNRGASGIDGIVSTALGVSAATGQRVVAVVGDVAFYHDMNGLLACREDDPDVLFVVIHNDGGGIFHLLPVREHEPAFTPYFATPHGLDFVHAARMYGLPYERIDDPADAGSALVRALETPGSRILEVRTDRRENEERHRAVVDAVGAAVRRMLADESGGAPSDAPTPEPEPEPQPEDAER